METIDLKLGSIPIRIRSDEWNFLDYSRSHFKPVIQEEREAPSVEVTFTRGGRREKEGSLLSRFDKVGRGIYVDREKVVWNTVPYFQGLTLSFSFAEGRLTVDARYSPVRTMKGRVKTVFAALSGGPGLKNSFYFELLYQLVYYPAFWILMNRGTYVLHGGGIHINGRGVVIVGAQGTGKSTLIANMLVEPGSRFLSDNLVLFDETRVFSCHEPVRIDDRLLRDVPVLQDNIEKIELEVPLGRSAYNVRKDVYVESMTPEVFIVPRMSCSGTGLAPTSKENVVSKVFCFNELADEVRTFNIFSSVLRQVFPSRHGYGEELATLDRLLEGKRMYEMNVKYGENPRETARMLIETVSK